MLVGDVVRRGGVGSNDHVALAGAGQDVTYAALADRVARLGGVLHDMGIEAGDRVALLSPNCAELVETVLAASCIGATVVPLNLRLIPDELRFQVDDADCRAAVVHVAFADAARAAGIADRPHLTIGDDFDERRARREPFAAPRPADDSVLVQLYTSGTTGRPKGCLLTQRNWLAATAALAHVLRLSERDVVATQLPLFHVAGLDTVLATLMVGGTVVLPNGVDPALAWQAVADHDATILQTVLPYGALFAPDGALAASRELRAVFGTPYHDPVLGELDARVEVWSGYGSTEVCGFATAVDRATIVRASGAVGRLMLGFTATIVDPESDRPLPTGETGELLVRGPSVTSGYWGLPDESAAALRDGWFHTGDLLRAEPDGMLHFVDRVKDMVKTGGENVYCVEVETALLAHPSVVECAVIGVPDARWGEAVKAVIVADGDLSVEGLDAWCLERLAPFKRPRWYELVPVLPRNAMTKVLKTELRAGHDPSRSIRLPERVPERDI